METAFQTKKSFELLKTERKHVASRQFFESTLDFLFCKQTLYPSKFQFFFRSEIRKISRSSTRASASRPHLMNAAWQRTKKRVSQWRFCDFRGARFVELCRVCSRDSNCFLWSSVQRKPFSESLMQSLNLKCLKV